MLYIAIRVLILLVACNICITSSISAAHQLINPEGKYFLLWNKRKAERLQSTIQPAVSNDGAIAFHDNTLKEIYQSESTLPDFDPNVTGMTTEYIENLIKNAFGKVLLTYKFINDKRVNILFSDHGLIFITVKHWFGWTTYTMTSNRRIQVDRRPNLVKYTIEYKTAALSPSDKKNTKKFGKYRKSALLKFSVLIDHKKNTKKLQTSAHISGLSKQKYKYISKKLADFVNKSLAYEILLGGLRFEQAKTIKEENKVVKKAKAMKKVDEILNPEKYKAKSPTVRRAGQGSGRYTPSAAAKARRVVNKGGG
jgi:hypothetical protein